MIFKLANLLLEKFFQIEAIPFKLKIYFFNRNFHNFSFFPEQNRRLKLKERILKDPICLVSLGSVGFQSKMRPRFSNLFLNPLSIIPRVAIFAFIEIVGQSVLTRLACPEGEFRNSNYFNFNVISTIVNDNYNSLQIT